MKYSPVTNNFCGYDFTSIDVDGTYYYPISQLPFDPTGNQGFPVRQKTVARDFKRLQLEDFSVSKFTTSLNSNKVDCVDHESLSKVVKHYARVKDSEFAWVLLEASFNTELKRSNDLLHGKLQQEEYYQSWREDRASGIKDRNAFTDYIQFCGDMGIDVDYAYLTMGVYRLSGLIELYLLWKSAHPLRKDKLNNPFRNTLNSIQLRTVASIESLVARRGNKVQEYNPTVVIQWVEDNL
jgi:hypothetical protein